MKFDWRYNRDFFAGLLYIVTGAVAMFIARDYPFGSALRMGPGYFPTVLGGIMIAFGLYVLALGLRPHRSGRAIGLGLTVFICIETGDHSAGWLESLKRALREETELLSGASQQDVLFGGEVDAGFRAMTQRHRDPLRPAGDEALFPTLDLRLQAEAPNVASAFHIRWDGYYLNDAQFAGRRLIPFRECDPLVAECAYRVEEGYVEVQLPYASLFFGREYRNWGLPGSDGFLVSNYAYSYDHIGYRFGSARLSLSGLLAPLNDFPGDTARYFSAHRLDWQVRDNLVFSASESVVYGGVNRRLDLNLTNPVGIWEISPSGGAEANTLGLAEVWWRPRAGMVTYFGFLVDNTRVGEVNEASGFTQWGAHLSVHFPAVTPALGLRGDVAVANSLAYRSRIDRAFYYAFDGLGLGRDKADAIVASVQADWFVGAQGVLRPRLDVQWKGQDDLRQDWPLDAFTGHDLMLNGTVETTVRPSIAGRLRLPRGEVRWDGGVNLIKNQANLPTDWKAKFVGSFEVMLRFRL